MPILPALEATLTQGEETVLFTFRFGRLRLTVTGIAGEFTTIPLQTRKRGGLVVSDFFEATQVDLKLFDTIPSAAIVAKPPAGVASLDIIYEVRTRGAVPV